MPRITPEIVERAIEMLDGPEPPSRREVAEALGVPESSLRYHLNGRQRASGAAAEPEQVTVDVKGDEATVTGPEGTTPNQVLELIRENGLDPDDWVIVGTRLNKWDGPVKGGGKQALRQVRVDLKRKIAVQLVSPASHYPEVLRPAPALARARVNEPDLIVVEGDHQVPYHDPRLHVASLGFLADVRPTEGVINGDLTDFPTISKYADHPAAMAAVQESIQTSVEVLRDKVEASPATRWQKLKGNHDWRVEGELLLRAERLHGVAPATLPGEDEQIPALSLIRLLRLRELGIELVEHQKGWEHGEIELVPGPAGLVVRHGFYTGKGVAARSLDRLGRSVIVNHNHTKEHIFRLDNGLNVLRQAVVGGTMSRNDAVFPHFAVEPDWHQGFVVVARWRDGRFQVEHAVYHDGTLTWRDKRWDA